MKGVLFMSKNSYIAVPNTVITDPGLYPSAKRVYVAMLACSSRKGTVRKTVAELAARSHCSPSAVQGAIAALMEQGMVQRWRRYRRSAYLQWKVYAGNEYTIAKRDLSAGYTLIPRSLLPRKLTHAAFLVALYLYMAAGRKGRAYPSLRHIAEVLYLSKSTVCLAVSALQLRQELYRYRCRKENHAYACNSYYPTGWIRSALPEAAPFPAHIIANPLPAVKGGGWSDFQQATRY